MKKINLTVLFLLIISIASAQDFTVVVIGSSTAEGTGPKYKENAWVNSYRLHLSLIDSTAKVINLARGGYTTYQLMPSDFVVPVQFSHLKPDTARNISKALRFNPDIVIINLPSNDNTQNVDIQTQLRNFNVLYTMGVEAGADTYVCTAQPRNFEGENFYKRQLQEELSDSIQKIYGVKSIDVFHPFADAQTMAIKPEFDSGDGIHLNDTAHQLFVEIVKRVVMIKK